MGVASHRGLQIISATNPYVLHIIRLASSSSTRCEGDLASGKSMQESFSNGPAHYPHVILKAQALINSPFMCAPHALINCM